MKILIDTSVWVECEEDAGFRNAVQKIIQRHDVVDCPIVNLEVENSIKFLDSHGMNSNELKSIYESRRKDEHNASELDKARAIADEYVQEGVKLGVPLRGMGTDLLIVSFASVKNVDAVVSLNRKSMTSDYARFVYHIVNSRKGLKIPQFIAEKSLIMKLSEI